LLAEVAGERPLVCLVDDVQWLDRASAQVLGFVARRLGAESVGLVLAARVPGGELAGLPELVVDGLAEPDARALLDSVTAGPVDERVRDRVVTETRGNPLALLELARLVTPAELAGGFGLPGAVPIAAVEESFRRRVDALPAQTRRLLVVAAADPTGDPGLVWRAAGRLGTGARAAAAGAGLVEFGVRVRFCHPLARAAAAFLERAAMLTPDQARRAQRLLAAAGAKRDAGALDAALALLVAVEAGPPDALRTAEVEHLRGQIATHQGAAAGLRGCC
jgi:hypothetical protein